MMLKSTRLLLSSLRTSRRICSSKQISSSAIKSKTSYTSKAFEIGYPTHKLVVPVRFSQQWVQRENRKEYIVTAEELKKKMEDDDVYLVDVREPAEVAAGRVPAKRYVNIPIGILSPSLNLSSEDFKKKFDAPRPEKSADDVVFMCKSGVRSTFALQVAQSFGISKSKHYVGGWSEWEKLHKN